MALITVETYKALTNTTDSSNDALIESLLESASVEVENYCDRVFAEDTYIEWVNGSVDGYCCDPLYFARQYPVRKILLSGYPDDGLSVTNNSMADYTFSISNATLTITDDSLTEIEYDLSNGIGSEESFAYADLVDAIIGDYPDLSITVLDGVINNFQFIMPQTYTIKVGDTAKIQCAKRHDTSSPINLNDKVGGIMFSFAICANWMIAYKAGYSTIPSDLQLIVANMVRDALNVQTGATNANLKSFSITNYSETFGDGVNMRAIVTNYADALAAYKRISF
jgi:hypothetical protein